MALMIVLLFVAGDNVNRIGIYLSVNGILVAFVSSGHALVLGGKYQMTKLLSHEILVFIVGGLLILFFFRFDEGIPLIFLFFGSVVFAHGSLVLKIRGETKNLFRLLWINISLKGITLFIFREDLLLVLALFGIADLLYLKYEKPSANFLALTTATSSLALGGFLNQFGNLRLRSFFEGEDDFEWIMRLIEMPSMLFWTFILYGWEKGVNYYNMKSLLYRVLICVILCITHSILERYHIVDLSINISTSIILYNMLKIELAILSLDYILNGRTKLIVGLEAMYLFVVLFILHLNLDVEYMIYILDTYAVLVIMVFLVLSKCVIQGKGL